MKREPKYVGWFINKKDTPDKIEKEEVEPWNGYDLESDIKLMDSNDNLLYMDIEEYEK